MTYQMQNRAAQQYAATAVETAVSEASPHKLIELLYAGVVKNLKLTKHFIEQKNYEKKSEFSNKSLSILTALKSGVDLEKGGDVAENLYSLYDYCYRTVFVASTSNQVEKIDEVLEHLEGLYQAWQEMPDSIKKAPVEKLG